MISIYPTDITEWEFDHILKKVGITHKTNKGPCLRKNSVKYPSSCIRKGTLEIPEELAKIM